MNSASSRASATLRSNSFNLVPADDLRRDRGSSCPLVRSGEMKRPRRSLYLRLRDRMQRVEVTSADFSDDAIAHVRDRDQQIYLDRSTKLFPDDFSTDLLKLTLETECHSCPRRPECGGCWGPASVNVFAEDLRRVDAILSELDGSVLDLGCGDAPYLGVLEAAARRGRVRYVGVDPDAARVRLLRSRHPWASYFQGTLVDFMQCERGAVDHVLMLRSYNHFPHAAETAAQAASLLREGGTLLVVDNVPFGLVRTRRHARRAENGPGAFEHCRNASAEDAVRELRDLPLKLTLRRDVTPQGSNEWVLWYEKRESEAQ